MDQISNEYSVFYLNHSEFPLTSNANSNNNNNYNNNNNFYKEFESNLLKIADNVIKSHMKMPKFNKFNFLRQLKNNDFFNLKIINRTKKLFLSCLLQNFKSIIEADLFILFEDYLNKNNKPTEKELDFYYDIYDSNNIQEKQSKKKN